MKAGLGEPFSLTRGIYSRGCQQFPEKRKSSKLLNGLSGQTIVLHMSFEHAVSHAELPPDPTIGTYRPLIMIVGFILLVTVLAQWPLSSFDFRLWMRHFMAGFFIVFAFFKLLNLRGFADSYAMYDIVAARWRPWGLIYPFVELGLGIAYLIDLAPFWTNVVTIVVLGVSSVGVIRSNFNKRKIKCACLGDVFNLPMSTVTVIEDFGMVAMAAVMLAI